MRLLVDFSTICQTFSCKRSYHGYKYKVNCYESTGQFQVQIISELLTTTIHVHSETFLLVQRTIGECFCCAILLQPSAEYSRLHEPLGRFVAWLLRIECVWKDGNLGCVKDRKLESVFNLMSCLTVIW